jgi:6-phosphogluconolactonase
MSHRSTRLVLRVVPAAALGETAAAEIVTGLQASLRTRDRAAVAFSGGSTPTDMLRALSAMTINWPAIDVFQVDERVAPPGSIDRNATSLRRELTDRVGARVHLIAVDDAASMLRRDLGPRVIEAGLTRAAARYDDTLNTACRGVLDIVHLGLGDDGHCASWGPGDPVIDLIDCDVAPTAAYRSTRRITLTPRAVNRARRRIFVVSGAEKTDALGRLMSGDPTIPASRVTRTDTVVIADTAAASGLG